MCGKQGGMSRGLWCVMEEEEEETEFVATLLDFYGQTFTSVVPDNTTRLVYVSVVVSVDTFHWIIFSDRGPSA